MKTPVEQLSEAQAEITSMTERLAVAEATIKQQAEAIEAAKSSADEIVARVRADLTARDQKISELSGEVASLTKSLSEANDKLALKAFDDIGGTKPVAEGGEPVAPVSKLKEFAAIADPAARSAYFRANKEELRREAATGKR